LFGRRDEHPKNPESENNAFTNDLLRHLKYPKSFPDAWLLAGFRGRIVVPEVDLEDGAQWPERSSPRTDAEYFGFGSGPGIISENEVQDGINRKKRNLRSLWLG
jgi:hypothetical protein